MYAQTFSISGSIIDESTFPMPYANILLLKAQDSTIITGTTLDDNGQFKFDEIKGDQYILKTSFIGFEQHFREINLNKNTVLDPFILRESAEALSQVNIIVRKPTLTQQSDRLVFNVQNTSLSEGNMMDVLRSTPSVLVLDGSILIRNTAPTVYINDRKVHLSSSEVIELLEGTSASNIKTVEVITNPSARYDADSRVVLNIVMTKNLITGYSGSVLSNYTQGVFPKTNYGISNYFKSNKWNVFVNYNYNNKKVDRVNKEEVNYLNEQYKSHVDRNNWSETHTINSNVDYEINDYNKLGISANMLFLPYFKYFTYNKTEVTPFTDNSISRFNSKNLSRDIKHNIGVNIDYEHIFKKDSSKITFNAHATTYDYRRKQQSNSDYFLGDNSFLESNAFKTRSDQATEIFTSQIDYSLPLNQSSTFEVGIKQSNIKTESMIWQRDIIGGQEVPNPNNSDSFKYNEDVYAGYLTYQNLGKAWEINAGIRVEQTNIQGRSMSESENNDQDYLEWFPSLSLSYKLSESTNLFTNYSRSIKRPDYSALNPFRSFLNDNTIVSGNPNLNAELNDYIDFGITFKDNYTFQVYYSETDGSIFELPIQDNINNAITFTPVNLSVRKEFGVDFIGYFNTMERWTTFLISSMYYTKDEGILNEEFIEKDIWANYSEMTNSFKFLKDNSLTADLIITYITTNIQGFQEVDTRFLTELSFRKTILKGKGVLSLAISDLFNEHDFLVRTKFSDQNSSVYSNLDNRYIRLGFRYKFGNTTLTPIEKELTKKERDRLDASN
jgi:outer membrane receptor protein involved in Fe transport